MNVQELKAILKSPRTSNEKSLVVFGLVIFMILMLALKNQVAQYISLFGAWLCIWFLFRPLKDAVYDPPLPKNLLVKYHRWRLRSYYHYTPDDWRSSLEWHQEESQNREMRIANLARQE